METCNELSTVITHNVPLNGPELTVILPYHLGASVCLARPKPG